MDFLSFIRTVDPTKVRVSERQRTEDEPKLLDTSAGRVVPLLPVAPARGESELEDIVDKLFDEGDNDDQAEQGDSAGGGQGPRRQKKRKTVVVDAGEPSYPSKKLRDDYDASTEPSVAGKSKSALQRLLVGAVLNLKVGIAALPALPFVTSFVLATPEREDSSHHSVAKEAPIKPSLFGASSSSAGGTDPAPGGFSDVSGSEFLIGGIHTVVDPDFDLQKLFTEFNVGAARQISLSVEVRMCAEYNIKEKKRLRSVVDEQTELLKVRDGEIENLKAQLLLKEEEAAEAIRLRTEASKFEAFEKSLELDVKVADLVASVKVREQKAADLDAMVTFVKSQNDNLVDQLETSSAVLQEKVTVYEDYMSQLEKFQDERMEVVYEKFNKLHADFIEMALHLEEKFYPHLLTTIVGRRWLLTYGMELVFAKCLNSPEYLSALGAAISKAIEKGMQDGLAAVITHGQEGRVLTDVAAFNPSAESDYISALQDLQSVNFSLLADLKSNKDASLETLMDILCLDETLAERLGLNESHPLVDQLMVHVHHSPDQTVIALRDVFVPLAEPLSIVALEGTGGTSGTAPDTTTALSTTYMSASSIPPISTHDYMVVHADSQEGTGANGQIGAGVDVNPFLNVEDAELDISW
ncbi:hypothetical protein Tco_0123433 [Tanacetum coccineum]